MSAIPPSPPSLEEVFNTPPDQLPRNKTTEAIHKRETWWQIYVPLLIGLLVSVGVCGLSGMVAYTSNGTATKVWSDISLVFLIVQFMVMVAPLLLIVAVAIGIGRLIKLLPPYAKVAQDYTALAARKTEWAMQYVVNPILQIRSAVAGLDKVIQNIRKFTGRG